ncbi:MAG: CoA-binding protein [bacterium]
MVNLEEVLGAKSVAVIGASRDPSKPGAMLLEVLKNTGFKGPVAGINPQGGSVNGLKLYRSLEEVPFQIDLAVMLIPPRFVPQAVSACAQKGVKGVVISAEGFAEAGPEGARIQDEVYRILRSCGMRGFGPNTLGLVNTSTGLTTSYFATARMLQPGSVGFAAQSGIFVGALLRYLSSMEGLRLSKGIGLGNKMDVNECDALEYLNSDSQTRIIGMYLEDVREGRRFLETARRAVENKPVVLLKGATTPQGAMASSSHTASLAVEDRVMDGALRQAGVIRVQSIEELISSLKGFLSMPLPKGDKIALVTYSGAQAILSIDQAARQGLQVARFSESTLLRLSQVIATAAKAANPVDLFPDMMVHGFERTSTTILEALLEDDGVHSVVFISFAVEGPESYGPLVELIRERNTKPVFFSLLGAKEHLEACRDFLEGHGIPCFAYPETAVKVISHMLRYASLREAA